MHFALVSAKIFSVLRPGKCTLGNSTLEWPRVGFAVETVDKIRSAFEASAVECNERKRAYFRSHCRLNFLLQISQAYGTSALSREFGGSCGATGGCPLEEVEKNGLSTGVLKLSSKGTKLEGGAIRFCGSFGGCSLDREKNGSNVCA